MPADKKPDTISSRLKTFDNITFFKPERIISNIPYFLFIALLAVLYIWNNHHGVKMVKEYSDTQRKMVEQQWYYNSTKDELTRKSRQSALSDMVSAQGMQELSNPPYTILEK